MSQKRITIYVETEQEQDSALEALLKAAVEAVESIGDACAVDFDIANVDVIAPISNKVTFNKDPEIVSHDDISAIHQEIEGYKYCERVYFAPPFAYRISEATGELRPAPPKTSETYPDEYETAKEIYEQAARALLPVHCDFESVLFDWRDEQELWIRYN